MTDVQPSTDTPSTDGLPPVIEADALSIAFSSRRRSVEVVRSASFQIHRGQSLALVGESGSGKTVTSMALMGLLPALGGSLTGGRVLLDGRDMTGVREREWQNVRGREIAMIFQQPGRALNPAFTIGDQIAEGIRRHQGLRRKQAWQRAVEMLDRVHVPQAERRVHDYPHEFSGGMAQRVLIAAALACEPKLLIADEPTTALDVTVQGKILELLREFQADTDVAILYITHDLGVVSEMCEEVAVMYAGEVVERGHALDVFTNPRHPYTEGLIAALPQRAGVARRFRSIEGTVPSPEHMPAGCRFHPRCSHAQAGVCTERQLEMVRVETSSTRCARHAELELKGVVG